MSGVRQIGSLAAALLCVLSGAAHAQTDSASHPTGMYTAEQSARGDTVYRAQCGRCHSPSDHSGPDFRLAWNRQTIRSLFDYLRGTMPDDSPGALTDQQYLDVTAYLLQLNGMPAGSVALDTADTTAPQGR